MDNMTAKLRSQLPRHGQPHMGGKGLHHEPPKHGGVEWDYMAVPAYVGYRAIAVVQSILKALGRGLLEQGLQDIHRKVRNDYGEVTDRTISRHLEALSRHGDVLRIGEGVPYLYKRVRK